MCNLKERYIIRFLFLSFTIFLTFSNFSYSQKQSTIDSLSQLLDKTQDSSKVAILRQLSWEYRSLDTTQALNYGNQALELSEKLNLKHEQADILGRLGVIKRNQGNYSKALDYYFRGLEIAQKNNYKTLQAFEFNNIGDIYNRIGIYDQAVAYVHKALNLSIQLKDKYTLSYIYHMLGLIQKNLSMPDSALFYFKKSLEIRKELNLQSSIATSYVYIGSIYQTKGNYDSSYINYNLALEKYIQMNDQSGIALCYKYIGVYYNQKKEYTKALKNFEKSLELIKRFGDLQIQKDAAEGIKYAYEKLGDYKKALHYQEFMTKLKDSITNNFYVQKITRLTENYKFEIKNQEQEILRKQKEKILNDKIDYQKTQKGFFIIAFVLMVILVGIIVFFYYGKNKAYSALNQKNLEIAGLNNDLVLANSKIRSQKEEIESQIEILQEQHDKLEILNSTKDKLFSIIAHDLRGPFTSIIGFSELLKENIYNSKVEDLEEMVNHINHGGINTLKILDNLLNWAKTQTHQVNINLENVNISTIINEVLNGSTTLVNSKKVQLKYLDTIDYKVYVDQNMVSTILRNLVSNSIKYSNQGGEINISVKQKDNHVEVSVQDNGVGMTDEIKNKLFATNVNTSTLGTANERGTGLGLVICNEFVKKLNGEIWVESEVGKGSIFTFSLPLSKI